MNTKCSGKIRVMVTLNEQQSKQLSVCRSNGLSDATVIESALFDYFTKNGVTTT